MVEKDADVWVPFYLSVLFNNFDKFWKIWNVNGNENTTDGEAHGCGS